MRLNILALETSSKHCSVALQYAAQTPTGALQIATRLDSSALSHSRSLLALINDVLQEANLSLAELDAIAVARGPGSFTGLRIGIAVAQGLAFGHQLPILPISSLAAVAYNALTYWQKQAASMPTVEAVLATMDARMGEVYCGWYDLRGELPVLIGNEHVLKPELLLQAGLPCLQSVESEPVVMLSNHYVSDNDVNDNDVNDNDIVGSATRMTNLAIAGEGLHYQAQYPTSLRELLPELSKELPKALAMQPDAAALLPLATRDLNLNLGIDPEALSPVYLRNNVTY